MSAGLQVKHITETRCPFCQAAVAEEKVYARHANGDWNEDRKFECGYTLHYSPNFHAVFPLNHGTSYASHCSRSDEAKEAEKARHAVKARLMDLVTRDKSLSQPDRERFLDYLKDFRV